MGGRGGKRGRGIVGLHDVIQCHCDVEFISLATFNESTENLLPIIWLSYPQKPLPPVRKNSTYKGNGNVGSENVWGY